MLGFQGWRKSLEPMVASLTAQFQMKNISEVSIFARHSDTGIIDANKLAMYRTSNKIFKSEKTVPEGKKSGFIMALDLSGSMRGKILDIFTQTAALMLFAKRNNIPFEVYGFTDSNITKNPLLDRFNSSNMVISDDIQSESNISTFNLEFATPIRLFVSGKGNLEKSIEGFYKAFCEGSRTSKSLHSVMGNTPLTSMIYSLDNVISSFKSRHPKIPNPVVIILSDGQDTSSSWLAKEKSSHGYYSYKEPEKVQIVWGKAMVTIENYNKRKEEYGMLLKKSFIDSRQHLYTTSNADVSYKTGWILDLLRQRHSDCRFIGYFVYHNPKGLPSIFKEIFNNEISVFKHIGRFRCLLPTVVQEENGFFFKKIISMATKNGFFKLNNVHGYDALFFIGTSKVDTSSVNEKFAKKAVSRSAKKIETEKYEDVMKTMVSIMDNVSARKIQKRFIADFIEAVASKPERGVKGNILS